MADYVPGVPRKHRCRAVGIGLDPPLDSLLKKLCLDPLVIACMTPLPVPANQPAPSSASTDGPSKGPGKGRPPKTGKGKSGKGKQSAGPSAAGVSLKELLANLPDNCEAKNAEGRFICPFYNKGICRFQKRKSCRFGKHVCYYKGCNESRPYIECSH